MISLKNQMHIMGMHFLSEMQFGLCISKYT